jgi:hypothetical protein
VEDDNQPEGTISAGKERLLIRDKADLSQANTVAPKSQAQQKALKCI